MRNLTTAFDGDVEEFKMAGKDIKIKMKRKGQRRRK